MHPAHEFHAPAHGAHVSLPASPKHRAARASEPKPIRGRTVSDSNDVAAGCEADDVLTAADPKRQGARPPNGSNENRDRARPLRLVDDVEVPEDLDGHFPVS